MACTRKWGFNHTHFPLLGRHFMSGQRRGGWARDGWHRIADGPPSPTRTLRGDAQVRRSSIWWETVPNYLEVLIMFIRKEWVKKVHFVDASQRKSRFQYKSVWEPPKCPILGTWWHLFDWILTVIKCGGDKSYENKLATECKWRNSGPRISSMFTIQKKTTHRYIAKKILALVKW